MSFEKIRPKQAVSVSFIEKPGFARKLRQTPDSVRDEIRDCVRDINASTLSDLQKRFIAWRDEHPKSSVRSIQVASDSKEPRVDIICRQYGQEYWIRTSQKYLNDLIEGIPMGRFGLTAASEA
ncbi:MAG: hypothetical protein IT410_02020 [Candidatus Doudnabacteria bacterium]|nr:hypothetical protein [Candidatus Doudnabacteria bacterium]